MRQAYIAGYDNDGNETILCRCDYWSPDMSAQWERLMSEVALACGPRFKMFQGWYSDENTVQNIRTLIL